MFRIELSFTSSPSHGWLTRVLFTAVAQGVGFNRGGFEGSYRIIPADVDDELVVTESGELERTDLLVDAIDAYASCDPDSTEFALMATYSNAESDIPCSIQLIPRESGYILSFGTNKKGIKSEEELTSFINLPKAVFERFEFVYGGSRVDEQQHIPTTIGDAQSDSPRLITFYPPSLVREIGYEMLRSSPASTVSELSNGGVYMLASPDISLEREQIQAIREHIFS